MYDCAVNRALCFILGAVLASALNSFATLAAVKRIVYFTFAQLMHCYSYLSCFLQPPPTAPPDCKLPNLTTTIEMIWFRLSTQLDSTRLPLDAIHSMTSWLQCRTALLILQAPRWLIEAVGRVIIHSCQCT